MTEIASERPIDVLLVEDNPGDVELTKLAFEAADIRNDLHGVTTGTEALDYLHQRGDYEGASHPDIVLLDLNLPAIDGIEVLGAMKAAPRLQPIPVIVLTSSDAEQDIVKSYENHASAFLTKPDGFDGFVDLARSIGEFWIQQVELPPAPAVD